LVNIIYFYIFRQKQHFFAIGCFHKKGKKAKIKGLDKIFFPSAFKYFEKILKKGLILLDKLAIIWNCVKITRTGGARYA